MATVILRASQKAIGCGLHRADEANIIRFTKTLRVMRIKTFDGYKI